MTQQQKIKSKLEELVNMVKVEVDKYDSLDGMRAELESCAIPANGCFLRESHGRVELILPNEILLSMSGIQGPFLGDMARRGFLLTDPSAPLQQMRLKGYDGRIRAHRLDVELLLDASSL